MGQNSGVEVKPENAEGAKVNTLSVAAEKVKFAILGQVDPETEDKLNKSRTFKKLESPKS